MKNKNLQAYSFLSPFIVLVSIFYIAPALLTIVMSFTSLDAAFIWEYAGFSNYKRIFMDPTTLTIVITPSVVYSVLWIWFLDASENGFINSLLHSIDNSFTPINWIAEYPFLVIVIVQVMVSLAYGSIIFSSAIRSIPENLFKVARVDGAGEIEIIKTIILPNISGHIKFITWLPDFTEMFDCSKWKAPKRTIRKTGKQVEVFNIKEYVQEVKKKKMRELMGEDQSSSLEHHSSSLPVTPRGSMTGSDPKKDKQDEESGFDVDSLIAKIDAKIAALEAEEAAEKVAKNWEVILLAAGESKLAVIKAIREHTKMGLKQAKDIVDHLPHTFTFRSEKKAEQVVNAISDAGGIAISGIADGDKDDDE